MMNSLKMVPPSRAPGRGGRFARGGLLRDLLGGTLLLAAWLALWTATWAAIAGPLPPLDPVDRAAIAERAIAGS